MSHTPGPWEVAAIPMMCFIETGANPRQMHVAGWSNGLWGLDFRVWEDSEGEPYVKGWALTHLPTGYNVCGILARLEEAQELADELATLADWQFDDAAKAADLSGTFKRFRDLHPDAVIRGRAYHTPMWPEPRAKAKGAA